MLLTQELLRNVQCSGSSVSFAKKMRALKMSTVADHLRLTWPIEKTIEADPLKTAGKLPKNSTSTILCSLGIWSKLERWKSLSGCLTSWPKVKIKKKKILVLKCCLLLLYATTNHFSTRLWHEMKVDFIQLVMTSSMVGPRSSKTLPKAKLLLQNGHGHCLVCCLSDPLQLSEFHWNHYSWEVCSAN